MRGCLLTFACFVMFSLFAPAQVKSPAHAKILIDLPEAIASESASIDYYMTGPFGGYGMQTGLKPNEKTYTIDAAVEDVPAVNVKVIVWIPSCEIVTLTIPIQEEITQRKLSCKPLGAIRFRGQLLSNEVLTDKLREITVDYLAAWSHAFFGITDGMVPQFRIGTAAPNADGSFEITLPDLASQAGMNDANFKLTLREQGTGNILAFLQPVEHSSETHDLKVLHEYPAVVQFTAQLVAPIVN